MKLPRLSRRRFIAGTLLALPALVADAGWGVGEYDLGWFSTANGPLYVNPGIGYIYGYDFRFNCRPEITVIEV